MDKRKQVADMMVIVHGISFELADYHAGEMTESEIDTRLAEYEVMLALEAVAL